MTVNLTTNYNFRLPVPGTEIDVWGGLLNANWTDIDLDIFAISGIATAALPKAGGTMTGALTLNGNPATALIAAPKQYVDLRLPLAGGTMTGAIVLAADGVAALNPVSVTQLNLKSDKGITDGQTTYSVSSNFALTDAGAVVLANGAAAITLTVQPQATVAWLGRTRIDLVRFGAGEVTITPGAGVTINSEGAKLRLGNQYAGATLYRRGADAWLLIGNIKT